GGGRQHRVDVVQHQPQVAQPSYARLGAHRRHAHLDAGVAERALLGLARAVVEVDLLVRAGGDALAPATATVLVDEYDAVLAALVDRPGGAGGGAGRVEAVLADTRQVEHERLLELELDLVGDLAQDGIGGDQLGAAGEVVVPVGAPPDGHVTTADEGLRSGDRDVFLQWCIGERLVVVGPGLVVVVDPGHRRVGEDRGEVSQSAARTQAEPPVAPTDPAALPLVLVLVGAGVSLSRPGLDVVEPHVLRACPVGPGLFAGDRAGVTPDALVEVHHHGHLCHHAHQYCTS